MHQEFSRTQLLLGRAAMACLEDASVAVFGIGGVGGYAAEALARSGVGRLTLVDDDMVCLTNINRQLIATHGTIGRKKVDVMKERILDINPKCRVIVRECFYGAETAADFELSDYDYIIDAIDTVSSKLILIEEAIFAGTPLVSCMGAGNKLDPTRLEVADIFETSVCPLARVMRRELKARDIRALKVVYSREEALKPVEEAKQSCRTSCICPPGTKRKCTIRRQVPGSVSFVPSVAGLILASEVVRDLLGVH
ncbi:tRNA threonylcarbamoyladenosine dehydratase [Oscillospiraceae bacterium CM]|nr:tRNA threonylcarbamoyladenosine dehydratase [Oscillospiraceae bacterium CM]